MGGAQQPGNAVARHEELRRSYRGILEAKRLAPEESVVRNNLGNTYCDKGDYDAAITEFRELFRMDSGWQHGHSCLARALMSKRDYESAIVELRAAILQNPDRS